MQGGKDEDQESKDAQAKHFPEVTQQHPKDHLSLDALCILMLLLSLDPWTITMNVPQATHSSIAKGKEKLENVNLSSLNNYKNQRETWVFITMEIRNRK